MGLIKAVVMILLGLLLSTVGVDIVAGHSGLPIERTP